MKTKFLQLALFFIMSGTLSAQTVINGVPSFFVDLTGTPEGEWVSPDADRTGNYCTTDTTQECIRFNVVLDQYSVGLILTIESGTIPGGSIYYNVDCGSQQAIIGEPVCINDGQPHILSLCAPGTGETFNTYRIKAIRKMDHSGNFHVMEGCTGYLKLEGMDPSSIQWSAVGGQYDSLLACSISCDSLIYNPGTNGPVSVSYEVTGNDAAGCGTSGFVAVTFDQQQIALTVPEAPLCFGQSVYLDGGIPAGGNYSGSGVMADTTFNAGWAGFGTHTITYSYTDPSGCTAETEQTISVVSCLGTEEESTMKISVFPNPVVETLYITTAVSLQQSELALIDMAGKTIITKMINLEKEATYTLPLHDLAPGVYFIRIENNAYKIIKK